MLRSVRWCDDRSAPQGQFDAVILPIARARPGFAVYGAEANVIDAASAACVLAMLEQHHERGETFRPGEPCWVPPRLASSFPGVRTDAHAPLPVDVPMGSEPVVLSADSPLADMRSYVLESPSPKY